MFKQCRFSCNTQIYLECYQSILDEMIRGMSSSQITDSISASFIQQMIPHHQAAIEMSENLLQYTTCIPLQDIAQNIITSQTLSIKNMTAAYPRCRLCINSPKETVSYEYHDSVILKAMFCEMRSACTDNHIDANFMREMIPHHRGAVCMSENALAHPLCQELVPLLESIITSQKKGIREMQQLLGGRRTF